MPYPSPFHSRMVALNETWKYKEWAGIIAPCRYIENHVYEYTAYRQSTGIIDVTPLYKYEVKGKDAAAFLTRVTCRDVRKMKPGRVTYLCWCDDDGKVVDDGTVTRLEEDWFRMTAAEPQYRWLTSLARGFAVTIDDISRTTAALAVQGPTSREVLRACSTADMTALKFFGSTAAKIGDRPVRITRTGYTGDLGYEVWCAWDDGVVIWDEVMRAGKAHGIVATGLDALDISRIEAGFVLLGVDYFSSPHETVATRKYSPFEIGLDWTVELERDPFVGQRALLAEKKNGGPARLLVGVEIDWLHLESLYKEHDLPPQLPAGASRESLPAFSSTGDAVGRISSSTWSPTLKRYLALGTVRADHAREGTALEIEHTVLFERKKVRARVVKRPFFDPERKRKP